jgi:Spy/CpxP family protein refolding chaperone
MHMGNAFRHAFRRAWRHNPAFQFFHSSNWGDHCGSSESGGDRDERRGYFMPGHDEEGSAFGVRRPLRFLAHKLDLDDKQVAALARILDALKIERAQAAVDDRRSLAEFADAVAGEAFDAAKASSAGERRVQSAARVRDTLLRALQEIHALLTPEQRDRLAYMLRAGILAV